MNKMINIVFISIFSILCIITVIHAGIDANNIKKPKEEKDEVMWEVVFETDNTTDEIIVNKTEGVEYDLPQLFDSIVNDFDVFLKNPKDRITFTFYISNESNYDSYILHYNKPKISCLEHDKNCISNLKNIKYSFVYDNGIELAINDIIKAKEKKKVQIKIEYKKSEEKIPMYLTNLGFSITFAKAK